MTDLMRTLYEFVSRQHMGTVWNDPEYRDFLHTAEAHEDRLRALLDEECRQLLRNMLQGQSCQHAVELEAMFQASLSLSRELNGLLRP